MIWMHGNIKLSYMFAELLFAKSHLKRALNLMNKMHIHMREGEYVHSLGSQITRFNKSSCARYYDCISQLLAAYRRTVYTKDIF